MMMRALILIAILLLVGYVTGTVLIADNSMSKMVELTTRPPYCHVHTDRGEIRNMLLSSDQRKVRQMSDDSIDKLVDVCRTNQVRSPHQGGFIYPGTKWCGPGDVARNLSDLGYHAEEDACCRNHDRCPNTLDRNECQQGICNDSPFTRSHCDCDATFRRCLQNVNTETANTIGAIFFNVVQVICFKERSPCSKWQNDLIDTPPTTTATSTTADPKIDIRIVSNDDDDLKSCKAEFFRSGRYIGTRYPRFSWRSKPEFFLNILLRKFSFL